MPFIRVRSKNGPKHEFDASVSEVEANPDLYDVIDGVEVDTPRDVVYIEPGAPQKQLPRKRPAAAKKKPATPATSIGTTETSEGEGQ